MPTEPRPCLMPSTSENRLLPRRWVNKRLCANRPPDTRISHWQINRLKYGQRKSMSTQQSDNNNQAQAPVPKPELASNLGATLLRVAWLAILLGLVMELLLVLASSFGGGMGGLGPFVADLVKHVSWSVFVCVGLAVGTAVIQSRGPVMGFLGLISAPIAFEISRVLHKGALEALAVSGGGGDDLSPLLVAVIKGIEYGCLGLGIGWVSQRRWGGALAHMAVGLAVGLIFGGTMIALTAGVSPPPAAADLFVKSINEVLFPAGCSMVLFAARALGKRAAPHGGS